MQTIPLDFRLALHEPRGTYEWSTVLLARAHRDGTLELLTAAWETVLGYGRRELSGKTLGQLMTAGMPAAAAAVAAILDPANTHPLVLTLRCRSGEAKCLKLQRRYDDYARQMYIVAEEAPLYPFKQEKAPLARGL
jgi:hypothetical protein